MWRVSRASAVGLGAQGKGDRAARFAAAAGEAVPRLVTERGGHGQVRRGAAASAWVVMQGSGGVVGRKGKTGERGRLVSG